MHIPDGFLSPTTYLTAWGVGVGVWWWSGRRIRQDWTPDVVPRLAILTAFCFVLGTIALPLPGGTSAHVVGVAALALLFGVRQAFLGYSLVLVLQSFLFGAGGVTALALNALIMGGVGGGVSVVIRHLTRRWSWQFSVGIAAWLSMMAQAFMMALILGLQPYLAHDAQGRPLYFALDWMITLPAVLIPHALIGFGEALITLAIYGFAKQRQWLHDS